MDGDEYVIIYQAETDGPICMERLSPDEIRALVDELKLTIADYAIVDGIIIKSFDGKHELRELG
jgi:hypothetical protein